MITCLSGNDLRAKVADSRTSMVLSKNIWQRLKSGTTLRIHVTGNLGVALFSPSRGDLQAAYDRNLQDYFLEYKNAVPELANISLDDDEVTPLILTRGAGLKGTEYYPIERIITGDVDYDTKVFVYNVMCKPTPDAFKIAERGGEGKQLTAYT